MADDVGNEATEVEELGSLDEESQSKVRAAASLVAALAADPGLGDLCEEVFDRYLGDDFSEDAGDQLSFALNHLVGHPAGSYLFYYVASRDPGAELELLRHVDEPPEHRAHAERVMRRLQAYFGYSADPVWRTMGQHPDDWEGITRRVYYEAKAHEWQYELTITKVNTDEIRLWMGADSSAKLIAAMLKGLNDITENVLTEEAFLSLVEQISAFLGRYGIAIDYAESEGPGAQEADDDDGADGQQASSGIGTRADPEAAIGQRVGRVTPQ